jgi:hypothetical protein
MGNKRAGITNAQAKFLAALQRELHVRYTGRGMSRAEASAAIDGALRALGREPKPAPKTRRRPPKPVREVYARGLALDRAWEQAANRD